MKKKPVLEVMEKRCNQCLFSKNKIVSDKRKEEILRDASAKDTYFTCHKASLVNRNVVCKGFNDEVGTLATRLAALYGFVKRVPIEELEDMGR